MTTDLIKQGYLLIKKLEQYEIKLEKLKRIKGIDCIGLIKHQSGAPEYSYDVNFYFDDDKIFIEKIKLMIMNRLEILIKNLKKDIEQL